MRKTKRLLSILLAFVMLVSTNVTAFASSTTTQISKTNVECDYICVNGNYFSQEEFETLLNETTPEECLITLNTSNTRAIAGVAGAVYFVPGLGEVVLLATGGILVGAAIYTVGTWAYDTFTNWLQTSAKKEAQDAAKKVSNTVKVKGSNDKIDLDQFKDKNGRTPKNKNSGTFTSTEDKRYTIVKDTAGHTGYDGTIKAWKLLLNGKRVASLNSSGKIVGK